MNRYGCSLTILSANRHLWNDKCGNVQKCCLICANSIFSGNKDKFLI